MTTPDQASEMVERVARAIYYKSNMQRLVGGDPYASDENGKRFSRTMARAAIEAMREPTLSMIRAAAGMFDANVYMGGPTARAQEKMQIAYKAMIEEALK